MAILDDLHIKKRELALQIDSSIRDTYRNMLQCYLLNFQRVWNNPDGLTPQQVIDALDVHAAELFYLADLCKQTLNAAMPGTLTQTPPYTVTVNPDGTVTVEDVNEYGGTD